MSANTNLPISIDATVEFEGDLRAGKDYRKTVRFTNRHIDPVELINPQPSHPDLRVLRYPVGAIMPGESSEIEVGYSPSSSAIRPLGKGTIFFGVKIYTYI